MLISINKLKWANSRRFNWRCSRSCLANSLVIAVLVLNYGVGFSFRSIVIIHFHLLPLVNFGVAVLLFHWVSSAHWNGWSFEKHRFNGSTIISDLWPLARDHLQPNNPPPPPFIKSPLINRFVTTQVMGQSDQQAYLHEKGRSQVTTWPSAHYIPSPLPRSK